MLQIQQGKPAGGYFMVFVPAGTEIADGDPVECIHPQTGKVTPGVCEFIINEPWIKIPDWVCCMAYGVNAITLKNALERKFSAFKKSETVKVLVVKESQQQEAISQ